MFTICGSSTPQETMETTSSFAITSKNLIPGVNVGYELALPPEEITFWSVIEAIEGNSSMFQCVEIRRNIPLLDKNNLPEVYTKCPCTIKTVMVEAENQMRNYLDGKTLAWLHGQVKRKVMKEQEDATKE